MYTLTLVSALLLTASAEAPEQLARAEGVVLILPLSAVGGGEVLEAGDAAALLATVAEAVAGRGGLRAVTYSEVNELVAHQKRLAQMGCSDEACIAEMSKVANAGLVIAGTVGRVGEGLVLSLSLVDAAKSQPLGKEQVTAGSVAGLIEGVPEAVAGILGGEAGVVGRQWSLPDGAKVSLAVFDLDAIGVSAETAQNLTNVLAVELKRLRGASVVSRDDIESMLQMQSQKNLVNCDDMACLAEIGGALGVDKLVVGHAGRMGNRHVVSLRLIDVRTSVVDARVGESFTGAEEQLLAAVRIAGRRLFGVESSEPGHLAILATDTGAEIFLDEMPAGTTPVPPLQALPPGRHAMRITKPGYYAWQSDVYVEPSATNTVWVQMESKPTWWAFWISLGTAGGLGAAGAAFTAAAHINAADFQRHIANGDPGSLRAGAEDRAIMFETVATSLYITAGVSGLVSVVTAILTDWE